MITFKLDLTGVNWEHLRQQLIDDDFHNGRSIEQYEQSYANSAEIIFAYDGETIIGTARMLSDGVCNAYIVDVWTHSAYRHQGIARQMMAQLEARASGQHICLWTDSAQGFYEKAGYQRSQDTLYEKVIGQWLQT